MKRHLIPLALSAAGTLIAPAIAQNADESSSAPIAEALENTSEDVQVYNDHLVTLASPYMEGRVPGSGGMERAKEYMEYYFRQAGLTPAFATTDTLDDGTSVVTPRASFRQPFPLGGTNTLKEQYLVFRGGALSHEFEGGTEFAGTALGTSGEASGRLVFVGYSIDDGPDGFTSFADNTDLTDQIAVMYRFEPMNDQGKSRWSDTGAWTGRAAFNAKLKAVADRGAVGAIVINTPGADDPRVGSLLTINGAGGNAPFPVVMATPEAGALLLERTDPRQRTAMDLRRLADEGESVVVLDGTADIGVLYDRESLMAENVGGLIPGKGNLADQYVIVGAHLDHLGMGYFGSRAGPGKLHPGADDNASGSAALLLMADRMVDFYDNAPDDANLRTIVYIAFSGEESGLNGSRYFVQHPSMPLENLSLMVNFDMIGRITNDRLSVSGVGTAAGMAEWLEPIFADSDLEIVQRQGASGGSDHLPFISSQIPVLFAIIADFHADYHTPADVSTKINRVGAVQTVDLFDEITKAAVQRPETFEFQQPAGGQQRAQRPAIKVRLGVMPSYDEGGDPGITLDDVTAGGPAESGGLLKGDRIVAWDGAEVTDIQSWMGMLAKNKPGDVVKVKVIREGKPVTVDITLEGR